MMPLFFKQNCDIPHRRTTNPNKKYPHTNRVRQKWMEGKAKSSLSSSQFQNYLDLLEDFREIE
jgi:hypothetical protein